MTAATVLALSMFFVKIVADAGFGYKALKAVKNLEAEMGGIKDAFLVRVDDHEYRINKLEKIV